ncbi:MAG: hypothetical protein ACI39U_02145 [Candidatus Cryptobacteroides sp.]
MKTNIRTIIVSGLMLTALAAVSACHKFEPESLIADAWHTILSFKYEGETNVTITSGTTSMDGSNPLTILRTGSDKTAQTDARLVFMSDAELSGISNSYRSIDKSWCSFDADLHFDAGQTGKTVKVTIDGLSILNQMRRDEEHTYVLPLVLEATDSVNVYKNYMIYVFKDGEMARLIDGTEFTTVYENIPSNGYGDFSTANLFDGNRNSVWRSVVFDATSCSCGGAKALWCNQEDHTEYDYTFKEFWNSGDVIIQPVHLPWILVFDMKHRYSVSKITTVASKIVENNIDMSSFYQRVKDYEYYVGDVEPTEENCLSDDVWTKVGSSTIPVYDGRESVLLPESASCSGRYLRLVIRSLHWREKSVDEIAAKYGKTYDQQHSEEFLNNATSVSKDPDYAEFKKCASVNLGPAIINEIEIMARNAE